MRNSLDTYERLLLAAKTYRNAMLSLASATSEFASALEECARQKGAAHTAQPEQPSSLPPFGLDDARSEGQSDKDKGEDADVPAGDLSGSMGEINGEVVEERSSGEKLMAAAGLHHVMSNQQQLLVSGLSQTSDHGRLADLAVLHDPVRHVLQVFRDPPAREVR